MRVRRTGITNRTTKRDRMDMRLRSEQDLSPLNHVIMRPQINNHKNVHMVINIIATLREGEGGE